MLWDALTLSLGLARHAPLSRHPPPRPHHAHPIVGATGLIGGAIAAVLRDRHQLVLASRHKAPEQVDISDPNSIRALYRRVGRPGRRDLRGGHGEFRPLAQLTDDDLSFTTGNKLLGQVNLVRCGVDVLADGGSFTLTTGVLTQQPEPGGAAFSLANGGVEALHVRRRSSCHAAYASTW